MKRLLVVLLLPALALASCGSASRPVELASATDITQPLDQGGPEIEIVFKNVSAASIVASMVQTPLTGFSQHKYAIDDVSSAKPLQPGQSTTTRWQLIGRSYQSDVAYPVTISGTLEDGKTFSYTTTTKIASPPSVRWQNSSGSITS